MRAYRILLRGRRDAERLLEELGADPAGRRIMAAKAEMVAVRVEGLSVRAANLLKQEMLARGGEVALPHRAALLEDGPTDAVILGTPAACRHLIPKLRQQPFGLRHLAERLRDILATEGPVWRIPGREFHAGRPGFLFDLPRGPVLEDSLTGEIYQGSEGEVAEPGRSFLWWTGTEPSLLPTEGGILAAGVGGVPEISPDRMAVVMRPGGADGGYAPALLDLRDALPGEVPGLVAWGLSRGIFLFRDREPEPLRGVLQVYARWEARS